MYMTEQLLNAHQSAMMGYGTEKEGRRQTGEAVDPAIPKQRSGS